MEDFVKLELLGDGVYLMTFTGDSDHRINPSTIGAIQYALDEVENDMSSKVLITTNEGRFYSNGLDPTYFLESGREVVVNAAHPFLERILCFPMPTIAAVCGHAAAGGCMMALAHDYIYMRSDKGFIFMNEIEFNFPLTPGMHALIRSKLPARIYQKAVLSGYRFSGKEAENLGFIEAALSNASSTQQEAICQASSLSKKNFDRATYKAMKEEMFKEVIDAFQFGGTGSFKTS